MPKPIRQDNDTSLRALRALAKLLARQAARQDFAKQTQQSGDYDGFDPGESRKDGT